MSNSLYSMCRVCVFPGLVHGGAGWNTDTWCDWTVNLERRLLIVFLFPESQVRHRLVVYWSGSHGDAMALVEMEEELYLGFK